MTADLSQKLRELQNVIGAGGVTRLSDMETLRQAADALERMQAPAEGDATSLEHALHLLQCVKSSAELSIPAPDGWRFLEAAIRSLAHPQPKHTALTEHDIGGAVARGWCAPVNAGKVMDPELELAITAEVIALYKGAQAPAPAPVAPMTWYDGPPPFPQDQEWFIAETIYGDRVALIALEEGRRKSMDWEFKTADGTYLKRASVKRWMQFPDCQYIPPEVQAPA